MKTSYLLAFMAILAVALVFGCNFPGGGTNKTNASAGGVTVTPTQMIAKGTATVQYTLVNNYENDMKNVKISLLDAPSGYKLSSDGIINTGTIVANQQYPAIFTITAPDVSVKQTLTPKIHVCYDYTTSYFFDAALKTSDLASETATVEKGASTGPLTISALGFDSIFITAPNEDHVGSLQISNAGTGKITAFNSIKINSPTSANLASANVAYSDCGPATEITPSTPSATNCKILNNALAVSKGLTATLTIKTKVNPTALTAVATERLDGSVLVNYCYDVSVGTLSVCPAGKTC